MINKPDRDMSIAAGGSLRSVLEKPTILGVKGLLLEGRVRPYISRMSLLEAYDRSWGTEEVTVSWLVRELPRPLSDISTVSPASLPAWSWMQLRRLPSRL